LDWQIAMMPGKRKALNRTKPSHALRTKLKQLKASNRANVEHPLRVIKCQFGHRKTLPGFCQEHQQVAGVVCVIELVDGAQTNFAGAAGMSAPTAQASARKLGQLGQNEGSLRRIQRRFQHKNVHA
jgi:hypothetical protein